MQEQISEHGPRPIGRRSFLLLLAACWIPVIVRSVMMYVARQFPQAGQVITVDAQLWQQFLAQQVLLLPVILVALYTGFIGRALVNDRRDQQRPDASQNGYQQ